jgi:putative photosynthetic complex assembly protein
MAVASQARFAKAPLAGLAAVLVATVIFAGFSAITGLGRLEAAAPMAASQSSRNLFFFDRDDGGVTATDATDGVTIAEFEPATNGFLRSTLRGLVRERKRRELGPEMPFRVSLEYDGRLLLNDPATGRTVDLRAFGPTNLDVFARLLPASPATSHR